MTEQNVTANPDPEAGADGPEGTDGEARRRSGRVPGKKLVLFIVLPMLLIGLVGAGVYFSGLADSLIGLEDGENADLVAEEQGPSVYYDLPEMLVNLNSRGRKAGYLKISVSLELDEEEDIERLEKVLPRIIDNFQVYLRELRVEDLNGSAGLQRLREELLLRVTNAAAPTEVKDILFREMLIQ